MEYAAQYHIGYNPKARTQKTGEASPANSRIRKSHAKNKGRRRNDQGQEAISTRQRIANDFLKSRFLPKMEQQENTNDSSMEDDFYKSLSSLCYHYHLQLTVARPFGYPYNIAFSLFEAETQLKNNVKNWDCLRLVQDENKTTFLISEERYRTGTTLYYIRVQPLFTMLKDSRRKKNACLLLSVCAYLYHIVDVPYYRQEDSYLYWMYEMLKDMAEENEDEENSNYMSELQQASWVGDRVEQKLYNRKNLEVFGQRLKNFHCKDTFDHECWNMAKKAFDTFSIYPSEHIFRNASVWDGDNEEEVIAMHKYISFMACTEGNLYSTLSECINNEFNEYAEMQEPVVCKTFATGQPLSANLDFENRIFTLIDDLCYILDTYKRD